MKNFKKVVHWFILVNLLTGFLAALYMVFIVLSPDGSIGPLYDKAKDLDINLFIKRRMYALEAWIIFGFLSLYVRKYLQDS